MSVKALPIQRASVAIKMTGYTQVYYLLTNAAGIVQSTIASGGTGTDN